ncbi:beta-amyrin 28-monooxygenase-like [Papaver somniferum]|uniref:beta-amyrin 28-monooxygenase-like n=1 Tax=Papaver somniferum TaxID=3469 RepID=UPI000E705B41|nr:beta-amyrin 28-monooxygenase-like [Papaver somniferum]
MERVVKQHLATNWDNKREVKVLPLSIKYTLCLICDLFLSIDDPSGIEELGAPLELFSLPIDLPGTAYNLGLKASKFLMNKLILIVRQRKIDLEQNKAPTTLDLLSYLLLEVDDDGNLLDESVIASRILGTFIGAHEASATVITFTIKYLAELPGVYSEVQKGTYI